MASGTQGLNQDFLLKLDGHVNNALVNTSPWCFPRLCTSRPFKQSRGENLHVLQYFAFLFVPVDMQGLPNFETHLNYCCVV